MRYFVFSDVHGNLQALRAVLDVAHQSGFDRCICIGDVIGYGANPIECWDEVARVADVIIMGNHEHAVINGIDKQYNYIAAASLFWTIDQLATRPDIMTKLRQLHLEYVESNLRFVHASPYQPHKFHYVTNHGAVALSINSFDEPVCFIGHTHHPWYGFLETATRQSMIAFDNLYEHPHQLTATMRCLVNVGSVGQPRDNNPAARFVIYDSKTRQLQYYQVDYDIQGAQRALLATTLPDYIAKQMAKRLVEAN